MTTPIYTITELANTSSERTQLNYTTRVLESLFGLVKSANVNVNTPPGFVSEGEIVLIGNAPTGAFSGFAGHLAAFISGAYKFVPATALTGPVAAVSGFFMPNSTLDGWQVYGGGVTLGNTQPWTKAQYSLLITLTDAATVTVDCSLSNNFKLVLGTAGVNRTVTFTNMQAGLIVNLQLEQDSTGSRTVTWGSSVDWGSNGAPTLSTGSGLLDVVSFIGRDTTNLLGTGILTGY